MDVDAITWTKLFQQLGDLRTQVRKLVKAQQARDPNASLTIEGFCEAEGIARPTYYELRKDGRGPEEMRLGPQIIRITAQAHARWRARREEETAAAKEAARAK
jgi:predicted DNA-binding transcriptional regulator AlpA